MSPIYNAAGGRIRGGEKKEEEEEEEEEEKGKRKGERKRGRKNVDRSRGHSTERRRWSLCTRGQRARTKDEHERGGEKGNRESVEDAFRCATRGIKDGRDFGNAGLYAANNQCILVCCILGLHGRLHRDKCNAANLLTPSLTYRVSEKLMGPADRASWNRPSLDRNRSR